MAFRDLPTFLAALEARGDLKKISAPVSAELEAAEIADRAVKTGGPALLFTNVKGSSVPLAMNLFGTMERMCFSLGVERLDDIGARVREIMEPEIPTNFLEKLKMLPRLARLADFLPKTVSSAPCQEVVERGRPSLVVPPRREDLAGGRRPVHHAAPGVHEGSRYGAPQRGMYRMHVYDETTTGMHWHVHKGGAQHYRGFRRKRERMPVAVALGGDPATIYAASAPLPEDIDEMMFSGFLRKEPVELVRCVTCDIEVPAHAEVILEGYVDPDELRTEGPFGDHTGYYSLADRYPVFHLTCVTRTEEPGLPRDHRRQAAHGRRLHGKGHRADLPPDAPEDRAGSRGHEPAGRGDLPQLRLLLHRQAVPGPRPQGDERDLGARPPHVLEIRRRVRRRRGHPEPLRGAVADREQRGSAPRHDDRGRPRGRPRARLSRFPHFGSKMGIDATRKWASEGFAREWPEDIAMPEEITSLVTRRWKEYGF